MKRGNPHPGISQALYTDLLKAIKSGKFFQGAVMPTVRSLAKTYQTSVNTVQRVMARLESDGFLKCRVGRNNIVTSPNSPESKFSPERSTVAVLHATHHMPADPFLEGSWSHEVALGISNALQTSGIDCIHTCLRLTDSEASLQDAIATQLGTIAGIVLFPTLSYRVTPELLSQLRSPAVTINRAGLWQSANFVTADYISAGTQLAEAFASQNISRVLLMGGLGNSQSWRELCMGYLQKEMEKRPGFSGVRNLETTKASEADGYEEIKRYLGEQQELPEAVVTSGDFLALGAIRALQEHGARVPDDVQVIGGSGNAMSAFTSPSLSVVAQPTREIGLRAGEMMARLIHQKSLNLPGIVVPTEITWRQSAPITVGKVAELTYANC